MLPVVGVTVPTQVLVRWWERLTVRRSVRVRAHHCCPPRTRSLGIVPAFGVTRAGSVAGLVRQYISDSNRIEDRRCEGGVSTYRGRVVSLL